MKETVYDLRESWAKSDAIRDAGLKNPENILLCKDIPYGEDAMNVLDVYYPRGTEAPLPTIISVHGGGWFYGSKELYSHYCMRLAQRGFTVVNFSYRLAPENKYPAAVRDICGVLHWVQANAPEYNIDISNLFMVGDSAGGQLCQQILTMLTNPVYAALFDFGPPKGLKVNACALNCGCYYFPVSRLMPPRWMGAIYEAYIPEDYIPVIPQLRAHRYITKDFPPAYIMTSRNDFLRMMAPPLYRRMKREGVECQLRIYGAKKQKEIGHVFHLNCKLELAAKCNDDECAFFRKYIV